MRRLLAVLLALGAVHCAAAGEDDAGASSADMSQAIDPASWMKAVDANASLAALTIPGTHESCARHEPLPGTAKCQSLGLGDQLESGVRYLDVRCRHFHDHFEIHHDLVYQQMNFDDVLDEVLPFLEEHPSETVIMSVKEEYKADGNTRSFEDTFASYVAKAPARWYLDDAVPSLAAARGKIVLLRRFSAAHTGGLNGRPWGDKATFSIDNDAHLRVQDQYEVKSNDDKWKAVTSLFDEAKSGDENRLFLNYTSGYKPQLFGIPNVGKVSDSINPKLETYFEKAPKARYGVVAMDFVDKSRAGLVLAKNFR